MLQLIFSVSLVSLVLWQWHFWRTPDLHPTFFSIRYFFHLGLSDVSSWLHSGYASWLEYCRSDAVPFSGCQSWERHFKIMQISCTSSKHLLWCSISWYFCISHSSCDGYRRIICQFHLSLPLPFPTQHVTRIKSSSLLSVSLSVVCWCRPMGSCLFSVV